MLRPLTIGSWQKGRGRCCNAGEVCARRLFFFFLFQVALGKAPGVYTQRSVYARWRLRDTWRSRGSAFLNSKRLCPLFFSSTLSDERCSSLSFESPNQNPKNRTLNSHRDTGGTRCVLWEVTMYGHLPLTKLGFLPVPLWGLTKKIPCLRSPDPVNFPQNREFFFENVCLHLPCACVYLHAFERSCTWWIKLLPERLTLHCTRCLWTWRSAARSMLSSPYYCKLVWGRWLKFAALVLVQKQCVIRSFCRNGRLSCLCAICVALCKSAYASAKEEKTASSIVQFECVSLLVRLTCQRSYPTSHSCTLKKKTVGILE